MERWIEVTDEYVAAAAETMRQYLLGAVTGQLLSCIVDSADKQAAKEQSVGIPT